MTNNQKWWLCKYLHTGKFETTQHNQINEQTNVKRIQRILCDIRIIRGEEDDDFVFKNGNQYVGNSMSSTQCKSKSDYKYIWTHNLDDNCHVAGAERWHFWSNESNRAHIQCLVYLFTRCILHLARVSFPYWNIWIHHLINLVK